MLIESVIFLDFLNCVLEGERYIPPEVIIFRAGSGAGREGPTGPCWARRGGGSSL